METTDRKTEVKDEDKHKDKDKRRLKPYGPEYQERYEAYRAGRWGEERFRYVSIFR